MVLISPKSHAPWGLAIALFAALLSTACQAKISESDPYLASLKTDLQTKPFDFEKGQFRWIKLGDLRPTQALIGHDQVNYKLGRYQAEPQKMYQEICESYGASSNKVKWNAQSSPLQPASFSCSQALVSRSSDVKTAIVAPDGQLYLTDGHHTFSTFMDMRRGGANMPVLVKIQENWSKPSIQTETPMAQFWQDLANSNNSWQFSVKGAAIDYQDMPKHVGRQFLANQAFRSLVYFANGIGWDKTQATPINFLEFHWGQTLAEDISIDPARLSDSDYYLAKIEQVARQMLAYAPDKVIAQSHYSAQQLGQKKAWNKQSSKRFKQLLCKGKKKHLGKLGYALSYQHPGLLTELCH
ncbi:MULTISPECIES: ParB/Srx family N-terminal domain-containing protein [unclassified Agarivorans]|uniref:ParB/Srx family N-terminal domain-containing protein n=1 Tax=unclassified Agarivorans TaxID=2636026 RepID=UPI003D7CF1FE